MLHNPNDGFLYCYEDQARFVAAKLFLQCCKKTVNGETVLAAGFAYDPTERKNAFLDKLASLEGVEFVIRTEASPQEPPAFSTPKFSTDKEIIFLSLEDIEANAGTQQRVKTDVNHVNNLIEVLVENPTEDLEPIVVFQVEGQDKYLLVDGFHRLSAYRQCFNVGESDRQNIPCFVHKGTIKEAILYSCKANAEHLALPRTIADKQKAVTTLLTDPDWVKWSDREIARAAAVSHVFVGKVRRLLAPKEAPQEERLVRRTVDGQEQIFPQKNKATSTNTETIPSLPEKEPSPPTNSKTISSPPAQNPIPISSKELYLGFISNIEFLPLDFLKTALCKVTERLLELEEKQTILSVLEQVKGFEGEEE